jgi:predicted permease
MRPEHWLYTIPLRLRSLFRRREADQELDEELRDHIERKTEEYVAEGLAPEEARRQALLEMGGVEKRKEECRDKRHVNWIQILIQDLRYGLRMLRRFPGFTAVAVLTLALGIGANTAIFSIVDGVILRPLPYPQSNRIVYFGWQDKQRLIPDLNVPEFAFIRDHASSFTAVAGFQGYADQELSQGASKRWVATAFITDGFFETLGVNPQFGRPFGHQFTRPGSANAAVLTYSLWRSAFASDPNIIGRQIILDDQPYTVTGVLPRGFKYTGPADIFVSAQLGSSLGDNGLNTDVLGRLKPGISFLAAQAEARLLGQEFFAQASPEQRQGSGVLHLDHYQDYLASDHRSTLLILLSAVGLLLLIACANVASLLLARATSRQKEISIRLALGAGPRRLLQQFLSEGLLLGIAGAAAGLAAAVSSLRVFVPTIPWDLPSMDRIGLDWRVLLFTTAIALTASILFGLASFFQTRKLDLNSTLKDGRAVAGASRSRTSLLNALVIGEIAISLTLALGAGLLIKTLYNLYQVDLGFNPAHLVLMHTPFVSNTSSASIWNFERQALARIQSIPGVQSAAIISAAPLHGRGNIPVQRDAHPEDSIGPTEYRSISSDYFSTMGLPILRGRAFQQTDFSSSAPIAIINETLARDWWPGQNPIGDRVVIGEYQGRQYLKLAQPAFQVVGVVADTKMRLDAPAPAMIYVPASQSIMNNSTDWVIRTSAPAGIAAALRKAITDISPDQRIVDLEPMSQLIGTSVAQPSFLALLMGSFGGLALVLTLVGVYGVISFQIAQRTHEIGVRITLGASRRQIWRLVVGKAVKVAVIGIVIGLFAAFGLTRLMASQLYNVQPTDPIVFVCVPIMVLLVALLAAYIPARRAMKVDPMVALRYE